MDKIMREGNAFVGKTIKAVRPISKVKLDPEKSYANCGVSCMVIELNDGMQIYHGSDPEDNRHSCLFATLPDGTDVDEPEEN